MRLASKHGENQRAILKADFTGGLNTSMSAEDIAENQLANVLNMEIDHTDAKLRTVAGTIDILETPDIYAAIHDLINGVILVVKNDKKIYIADFDGHISGNALGVLTGELYPKYAAWENGVLIASGGKLQYFNGSELVLIDSPQADDVFIRAGRVIVAHGSTLRYSGVGGENYWREDSNVESSSKFIEAGYKDGSSFVGVASLSQSVLIIKTNKICYRLADEYPRWSIAQVATNIECNGRRSYCAVGDDVFILGVDEAFLVQNTYYGNVKPEDIAALVKSEIRKLPKNAPVKYVAPLAQVWCIGQDGFVLIFDMVVKSWFKRKFNSEVLDVFSADNEVYVVKPDRISKLDKTTFKDNGEYMNWYFFAQRQVSHHDFLLKRSKVSVTPLNHEYYCGHFNCGRVKLPLPVSDSAMRLSEGDSPIFENNTRIMWQGRRNTNILPQIPDEKFFWDNYKILPPSTFVIESRNVFRSKYLDVGGHGQGGGFIVHSIIMDVAEV